jgi:hypothetical protein
MDRFLGLQSGVKWHVLLTVALAMCVAGVATGAESAGSGISSPAGPKIGTLADKTLVTWVYSANLTQQGSGAMSLIDSAERFDAIVLGEIAKGKWMAGSDFFHRTPRDQTAWPAETADAKTLVQLAGVYRGAEVTIYRDGKRCAGYRIDRPQTFGSDCMVLLGIRYIGSMGAIGFFAGAVEEARVYGVALQPEAVAALAPKRPSDPKPIGLWSFEDGTANDAMGNFPKGVLCGGARIADGKLHLNGVDAYMISEPSPPEIQGMFYRPYHRNTGRMWDTWLYYRDATFYLFCLANAGSSWDNISMAVSGDGVHWKERGPVLHKAPDAVWMGTGSTWPSPNFAKDKKYFLNFSEWRGPRQTIFFAQSDDLHRWTRLPGQYEFRQDPRWYEPNGRWDCIWAIPRPGGGRYGYWTANPKGRIGFGFGESLDGISWRALDPPKIDWTTDCEAGAVEKIGDRYYLMLGTHDGESHHGMFTFVAEQPGGPFLRSKKNFRLLTSQGHLNTYFARFFPTPQGVLVNHHSIARGGMVHFGSLKRAAVDAEGTLRLAWWEGNEKLKHESIPVDPPPRRDESRIALLENRFDAETGLVLEATLPIPVADEAKPVGLYVEHGPNSGTALLVRRDGVVEIGAIDSTGAAFKPENRIDRQTPCGATARFRLLLKQSLLEFYLDDVLIQCYSLPAAASGRIGFVGRNVANLKAWR